MVLRDVASSDYITRSSLYSDGFTVIDFLTMAEIKTKKSILFVHPDLGIGGAERLVIDAAVGLQSLGHRVAVLTSYRDKKHCFDEAKDGMFPPLDPAMVVNDPSHDTTANSIFQVPSTCESEATRSSLNPWPAASASYAPFSDRSP